MADGCELKWGKFKWDRAGYAQCMNDESVQGIVKTVARSVRATATSMLSADGHTVPGFTMSRFQGKLANGYSVKANSKHAKYASLGKQKLLTKAAKSVRF